MVFVTKLLADPKGTDFYFDPTSRNMRAIRSYKKLGFAVGKNADAESLSAVDGFRAR